MAVSDHDIDELYQLPREAFTKARDALAKRAGSKGATIRTLVKPNVPAWAVNQLYWRARGTHEALVASANRLRTTQLDALRGGDADVERRERDHASARRAAVERVRAILDEAGETASPATITAINETLDALPAGEPGRLSRPMKPMGFEGLANLLRPATRGRPGVLVPFVSEAKRETRETREKNTTKREAEIRARALREATAERRKAEVAARKHAAGLKAARRALAHAERARDRAAQVLESATTRATDLAARVAAIERRAPIVRQS